MDKEKWMRGAAVFSSCYIKRWLEGRYDQLMDIPALAKLRAASQGTKLVVEACLAALTAYGEQKMPDNTFFGRSIKPVLMDIAPEISSRLLKDTRDDLNAAITVDAVTAAAHQLPSPSVINKLLALEDEALLGLLTSLEAMDDLARERFKAFSATANLEDLKRFGTLPLEKRLVLLNLQPATGGSGGKGGGGGGWMASVKEFGGDFWRVFKPWAAQAHEFNVRLLSRYMDRLLTVLKTSSVLWGIGLVVGMAASTCGRWPLFALLIVLLAGCGGLIIAGRKLQLTWLTSSGIISSVVTTIAVFLAASNYADSIAAVVLFFLILMPTIAIAVMLLPLTTIAEVFRRIFPEVYRTLVRSVQMLASVFFGSIFFVVILLFFPPHNPVAFLFIVPAAIVMALVASTGVVRINPEVFLRAPVILGFVVMLFAMLGLMNMPNLRNRIANSAKITDRMFVGALEPVEFATSKDIDFMKDDGTVKIWYAERPNGGFDLFRNEGVGPYYAKDGRQLKKADNADVRQKISVWVAQEVELKAAAQKKDEEERAAKALAQKNRENLRLEEERRQQDAEKKKRDAEEATQRAQVDNARRAGYLAMTNAENKVDFIVCAEMAPRVELSEFSTAWVDRLRAIGKTATAAVFTPVFVSDGAFDLVARGQGRADIEAMPLAAMGNRLLLAKCEMASSAPSSVEGVTSAEVKMQVSVVDAGNGQLLESFVLSAASPGASPAEAKTAAFTRILDQLAKRSFGTLEAVEFSASKDIDFTKDDGTVKILYAERPGGGFDLFRNEGVGPYFARDGRKLKKADSDDIRQKIVAWVDKMAVQKAAVQHLAEENQKNEKLRLAAEAEAQRVQAEKARLASYTAMTTVDKQLDFIVCAEIVPKQVLAEFSTAWVERLRAKGKTATDSVITKVFVTRGTFDLFASGQGIEDIRDLPWSALGRTLLLARCETIVIAPSPVAGVTSAEVKMEFAIIDTKTGKRLENFSLSAVGPGTGDAEAKTTAFSRILDQLAKRGY